MTIRLLKELIKDLPDDMRIYADDGSHGLLSDNNEFLTLLTQKGNSEMCVLQTREDFDVAEELDEWCKQASENDYDELDFWIEFAERGYVPADFSSKNYINEEKEEWAHRNLKHYGLV